MKKIVITIVLLTLIFGLTMVSGCTISEEKEHGLLTTKKTTTSIGEKGIQTETKNCPFWNRDC